MRKLFNDALFWDTLPFENTADYTKYYRWVIERVLNRGDLEDYKTLEELYRPEQIIDVVRSSRNIAPRAIAFAETIWGTLKEHSAGRDSL